MIVTLLSAFLLLQQPDTLQAAGITALRAVAPPTESLSGERLRAQDNLADAIRDFAGIQIRDYGGAGGLKTINVRSLGSAHTAVFLDGMPIENAQNMQVDLGRLFTDGLEKVELYQGQRSQLLQSAREYGSASALHLSSAPVSRRRIRLQLGGGAFGTVSPSASLEMPLGERLSARVQAAFSRSHGRYRFHVKDFRLTDEGYYRGYDTVMTRQNCDLTLLRTQAQLFWKPAGGNWQASASWYDARRGIPGPVYKQADTYPLSSDRQDDRSLTLQVGGTQRLAPRWQLLVRGKYALDQLTYLDVSELDPVVQARWDYRLQSGYLSTALGWQATPWLHLSAALDGQTEHLRARLDAQRQTLFGALAGVLLQDPWKASLSLQYQSTSDGCRCLSPALLVNWHPREDWTFGALVKRSCRLPSFNDLYYTNVMSRDLLPEAVWQTSLRWCWDRSYGNWHFRAWEELYYNHVLNKLVAVPNGSLFRWSMYNIGEVNIWGDELSASASGRSGVWDYGLTARYTFQWARDPADGYQIPYIPVHSASFQAFGSWRGFRLRVEGFLSGTRYTAASDRPECRIGPWTTWDASLGYGFGRLELEINLRNLFDEQYEIIRQYPMPGFHVLGRLAYSL